MDLGQIQGIHVVMAYIAVESIKWITNRFINEKEQFKILHSISKSQEAIAESFAHVALILQRILSKIDGDIADDNHSKQSSKQRDL